MRVLYFAAWMTICLPVVASVRQINLDPNNLSKLTQHVLSQREIQISVQQMSLENAQAFVESYYETVEPAQMIVAAGISLDGERLYGLRQLGLQQSDIQPRSTFSVNAVLITRQILNQSYRINSMTLVPSLTTVLANSSAGRQTGNHETQTASSTIRPSSVATRHEERPDARPRPDTAEALSGGLTEEEVKQNYEEVGVYAIMKLSNDTEIREGIDLGNVDVQSEGMYMRFNDFLQQNGIRIENFDEERDDPADPTGCLTRVFGRRLEADQGPSYVANLMKHLRFFQKK